MRDDANLNLEDFPDEGWSSKSLKESNTLHIRIMESLKVVNVMNRRYRYSIEIT